MTAFCFDALPKKGMDILSAAKLCLVVRVFFFLFFFKPMGHQVYLIACMTPHRPHRPDTAALRLSIIGIALESFEKKENDSRRNSRIEIT